MDRVNGNNPVDIGGGRRGFQSQNAAAGVAGTEVTAKYLNDVQEEICTVIEKAGFELDPENQQQLWEALQSISAPGFANRAGWLPVISITMVNPPNDATVGDAYIIPAGATGTWAGNQQKLAEWTGSTWRIVNTKNGHGVGLPDGRIFEKVGGTYIEKIALDAQSGKWSYATAGGSANALTVNLAPIPPAYSEGMIIRIRLTATNTGAATINVNGLGEKPIRSPNGDTIRAGDLLSGAIVSLIYSAAQSSFCLITPSRLSTQAVAFSANTWGGVSIPSVVTVTPTFSNILFDTHNGYNPANGRYTVPFTGVYSISSNVWFDNGTAATNVWIIKKGEAIAETAVRSAGRVLSVSALAHCVAGDTININIRQENTSPMMIPSGSFQHAFSASLVGNI